MFPFLVSALDGSADWGQYDVKLETLAGGAAGVERVDRVHGPHPPSPCSMQASAVQWSAGHLGSKASSHIAITDQWSATTIHLFSNGLFYTALNFTIFPIITSFTAVSSFSGQIVLLGLIGPLCPVVSYVH